MISWAFSFCSISYNMGVLVIVRARFLFFLWFQSCSRLSVGICLRFRLRISSFLFSFSSLRPSIIQWCFAYNVVQHSFFLFLLNTVDILVRKTVPIFAFEYQQVISLWEQIKISHQTETVKFSYLCKLLQCVIHVFWYFGSQVNIRLLNYRRNCVPKLDLLNRTVEVHIYAIFEPDFWIIEHLKLFIVGGLSFVF